MSDETVSTDTSLIDHLDVVPVDELRLYHRNARKGSVPAIKASLEINRQYKPLVVNRGAMTGRPGEVLAGNHTLLSARELGWSTVVVVWVDVDDEHAARIALSDNRSADLGDYDDRLLLELLETLPDLDGTGYDVGDLDALAAALEDPDPRPDDDRERPTRKGSRQISLTYDLGTHEWITDRLIELADQWGVDDHAAVILRLVMKETGSEPNLGAEHPMWRDAPPADETPA